VRSTDDAGQRSTDQLGQHSGARRLAGQHEDGEGADVPQSRVQRCAPLPYLHHDCSELENAERPGVALARA